MLIIRYFLTMLILSLGYIFVKTILVASTGIERIKEVGRNMHQKIKERN